MSRAHETIRRKPQGRGERPFLNASSRPPYVAPTNSLKRKPNSPSSPLTHGFGIRVQAPYRLCGFFGRRGGSGARARPCKGLAKRIPAEGSQRERIRVGRGHFARRRRSMRRLTRMENARSGWIVGPTPRRASLRQDRPGPVFSQTARRRTGLAHWPESRRSPRK